MRFLFFCFFIFLVQGLNADLSSTLLQYTLFDKADRVEKAIDLLTVDSNQKAIFPREFYQKLLSGSQKIYIAGPGNEGPDCAFLKNEKWYLIENKGVSNQRNHVNPDLVLNGIRQLIATSYLNEAERVLLIYSDSDLRNNLLDKIKIYELIHKIQWPKDYNEIVIKIQNIKIIVLNTRTTEVQEYKLKFDKNEFERRLNKRNRSLKRK